MSFQKELDNELSKHTDYVDIYDLSLDVCKKTSKEVVELIGNLHEGDDNYFYSSEWWDTCEEMDFADSQKICEFLDFWEKDLERSSSWILNFICGM